MSQKVTKKDTSNVKCLLLQILFTLLFCTILIIYALFTRPNSLAVYAPPKEFYSRLKENSTMNTISASLTEISLSLQALQIDLRDQQEQEELTENEPISQAELYDSYVYEITSTRYPSLDPQLVRAIIYHESRYNAESVNSKTSATGLMQLSPKWQAARAKVLGVNDLTDPYGNILTGCDFLNELFERYSFNYALNIYVGGYRYADQNRGRTSNYVLAVQGIMNGLADGTIIPGGD